MALIKKLTFGRSSFPSNFFAVSKVTGSVALLVASLVSENTFAALPTQTQSRRVQLNAATTKVTQVVKTKTETTSTSAVALPSAAAQTNTAGEAVAPKTAAPILIVSGTKAPPTKTAPSAAAGASTQMPAAGMEPAAKPPVAADTTSLQSKAAQASVTATAVPVSAVPTPAPSTKPVVQKKSSTSNETMGLLAPASATVAKTKDAAKEEKKSPFGAVIDTTFERPFERAPLKDGSTDVRDPSVSNSTAFILSYSLAKGHTLWTAIGHSVVFNDDDENHSNGIWSDMVLGYSNSGKDFLGVLGTDSYLLSFATALPTSGASQLKGQTFREKIKFLPTWKFPTTKMYIGGGIVLVGIVFDQAPAKVTGDYSAEVGYNFTDALSTGISFGYGTDMNQDADKVSSSVNLAYEIKHLTTIFSIGDEFQFSENAKDVSWSAFGKSKSMAASLNFIISI